MVWTIDYTDTAKTQLRKLDKQVARRILDFMDERVAARANPRNTGRHSQAHWAACGVILWMTFE